MKIENFQLNARNLTSNYFYGFLVGASEDGTVYQRKKKNEYMVEIEQKSKYWLEFVQEIILRFYKKSVKIRKTSKGFYRIRIYSKKFFNQIKKHRINSSWILRKSKEFQLGFLQGVYDAEGSIKKSRNHITISSNRKDLIRILQILLRNLNFRLGKTWKDYNGVITLPFYGKDNLKRFQELINFRHPKKKERLAELLNDNYLQTPKMVS